MLHSGHRTVHAPLDAAVWEQSIAESHGNPLAQLELSRTWSTADLAGGLRSSGRVSRSSARSNAAARANVCRTAGRDAVAGPRRRGGVADPVLLHRAAAVLGLEVTAAGPAVRAALTATYHPVGGPDLALRADLARARQPAGAWNDATSKGTAHAPGKGRPESTN